jgi:hypothetical protein
MPSTVPDGTPDSRFSYFLLQAQIVPEASHLPALVRLTVEDLSSGEKRVFGSVIEFTRFLDHLTRPTGDDRWAPPAGA